MAFDPTAWTRAGAADLTPTATSGLLKAASLGGQNYREAKEEERLQVEEEDKEKLKTAHKSAEESWINGDQQGFNQAVGEMSRYNQEAADGTVKLYGTLGRNDFVGASYQLMAAMTSEDPEEQNEYINAAIAQMGANHPYSQLLMKARDMPAGKQRNALLLEGLNEAKRLRAFPGTAEKATKSAEQIERDLLAREGEAEIAGEKVDLAKAKLGQREEEHLYEMTKVPGFVQSEITAGQNTIADNNNLLGRLNHITSNLQGLIDAGDTGGGMGQRLVEWGKELLGTEDEKTLILKMARDITVTSAIKNLPPGVASDKDIELVMGPVPGPNMKKETLQRYFNGMQRVLLAENARVAEKERYMGKNGQRGPIGFTDHWRKYGKDIINTELAAAGQPPLDETGGDIVGAAGPPPEGTSPASPTGDPAAPQPTAQPGETPPPAAPTYRYNLETKQMELVQ